MQEILNTKTVIPQMAQRPMHSRAWTPYSLLSTLNAMGFVNLIMSWNVKLPHMHTHTHLGHQLAHEAVCEKAQYVWKLKGSDRPSKPCVKSSTMALLEGHL